jgi:hypothetical protein
MSEMHTFENGATLEKYKYYNIWVCNKHIIQNEEGRWVWSGLMSDYEEHFYVVPILREILNEAPWFEKEFSNYRKCYEFAYNNTYNGVIHINIRDIFANKPNSPNKRNYHYRNWLNTEELIVKCTNRKYLLKYRILLMPNEQDRFGVGVTRLEVRE